MSVLQDGIKAVDMEQMTRTFSSFSGSDIVATVNGRVIGEIQAISYSATREKAPIFTMGSPDARSFSRGKRGLSGELMMTVFDRDALIDEMYKEYEGAPKIQRIQQYKANMFGEGARSGQNGLAGQILNGLASISSTGVEQYGVATWDSEMTKLGYASSGDEFDYDNLVDDYMPEYADQILPFNITISGANEYGARAAMEIFGVEILNEVSGFSVDDLVTVKMYTWVGRKMTPFQSLDRISKTRQASKGFGEFTGRQF